MWGVKNFLPPMGEDEDEETTAAHEKRLQHQSQLSNAGFPKGVPNMGRRGVGGGGAAAPQNLMDRGLKSKHGGSIGGA